ncbi:hypothetical protein FIBSPDRAFT_940042 [Athelia psychrophila]|uniref:Uncharacterized protein n=1 Tax=Athelia psychrophila TaxID=1759441 RepID=A0A167WQH6_9AGAM|nr:hypothetical protein FIBSPDRAFT_940042 [Fibularhizoctonia sp. CBS 109695]
MDRMWQRNAREAGRWQTQPEPSASISILPPKPVGGYGQKFRELPPGRARTRIDGPVYTTVDGLRCTPLVMTPKDPLQHLDEPFSRYFSHMIRSIDNDEPKSFYEKP